MGCEAREILAAGIPSSSVGGVGATNLVVSSIYLSETKRLLIVETTTIKVSRIEFIFWCECYHRWYGWVAPILHQLTRAGVNKFNKVKFKTSLIDY